MSGLLAGCCDASVLGLDKLSGHSIAYICYTRNVKRRPHESETDSADRAEDRSDQEGATGDRSDAPGFTDPPIQGSPTPHRGLLADQLYPTDEEPHRVRPQGIRKGGAPPDRDPQAVQTSGSPVDRPEYRALTADHADCGTEGKPIGWNSILARRIQNGEVGIRQTACGSSRADDAQGRRDRRAV